MNIETFTREFSKGLNLSCARELNPPNITHNGARMYLTIAATTHRAFATMAFGGNKYAVCSLTGLTDQTKEEIADICARECLALAERGHVTEESTVALTV